MNELSVFERRLSASLEAYVGSRRPVDGRAITRAAAARAGNPNSGIARLLPRAGSRPWDRTARSRLVLVAAALLTALLITGAIAVGSGLVRLLSVVPQPSLDVTQAQPSPTPLATATSAPALGGGYILATLPHPGNRPCNTTAAPFDVVTIDPGTGATTLLGTTASSCDVRPFDARWAADRTAIVLLNRYGPSQIDLRSVTDAGRRLPVICCGLPTDVWEGGGGDGQGWSVSPRGDRIAAIHTATSGLGDAIVVADIDGQNARRLPLPDGAEACCGFAWSPDELALAVATSRGALLVVPVDGSSIRTLVAAAADSALSQPAWSPDGSAIAVVVSECPAASTPPFCTTLASIDVTSGMVLPLLIATDVAGADADIWGPSWAPDGQRIGFGVSYANGSVGGTFLADRDGANAAQLDDGGLLAWSPDGQWLLISRGDVGTADVWIVPVAGGAARELGMLQGADW